MYDDRIEWMIHDLKDKLEEIEELKSDIVFEITGVPREEQWVNEYMRCEDSPIGVCVFDNTDDPKHENCMFCNSDKER